MDSKTSLLRAISSSLCFPEYFGMNWDALEECIRDLSWLPKGDVLLVHESVPLRGDYKSLEIYLSILSNAAVKWMKSKDRRLLIAFPPGSEAVVHSAAGRGDT
jgi:hypothetical protein